MPDRDRTPRHEPHPLPRLLHMLDGIWSYQIGDAGIRIRCPDLKKTTYVTKEKLMGRSVESWEGVPITPADVRNYVAEHLDELKQ